MSTPQRIAELGSVFKRIWHGFTTDIHVSYHEAIYFYLLAGQTSTYCFTKYILLTYVVNIRVCLYIVLGALNSLNH